MPTNFSTANRHWSPGAPRRIGREIALALAKAGADVAITYRNSAPRQPRPPAKSSPRLPRPRNRMRRALRILRASARRRHVAALWQTRHPRQQRRRLRLRAPWNRSASNNGTRSSKPTPAARFWLPAKQSRICAPLTAESSTSVPSAESAPGPASPLLRLQGSPPHAHPGHGQGIRPRGQRQLRCPRLD